MLRRLHAPALFVGVVPLDAAQARHARDVLRLPEGSVVEVFDHAGGIATGTLIFSGSHDASVRVERVDVVSTDGAPFTVAAAVPKGERADWMIEKLSELGAEAFMPLAAKRSVVLPEGRNKRDRWMRIATESAKQSRRQGVMRIEPLATVEQVLEQLRSDMRAYVLSTEGGASPLLEVLSTNRDARPVLLLVGPEGGWTDAELARFNDAEVISVRLTRTILRIETAAIAGAALVAASSLLTASEKRT